MSEHDPDPLEDPVDRRRFLELLGASLGLAGISGAACSTRTPPEKIVPYVRAPEDLIPGRPLRFATATTHGGSALGLLVESHEGRPTKVEGNPEHPTSLGATDVFAQASVLGLYDPDRSQTILEYGRISTWGGLSESLRGLMTDQRAKRGAGLRILTGAIASPALEAQLGRLLAELPEARWCVHEPIDQDAASQGARLAFGADVAVHYRVREARAIVCLDADLFSTLPGAVRHARDFADGRRAPSPSSEMNRLYVVEPTPSITGSLADHRLPLRASAVEGFARALAAKISGDARYGGTPHEWIGPLAKDLLASRGASLIVAGEGQPPVVHALALAINAALGNLGRTVIVTPRETPHRPLPIAALAAEMAAGRVELLIIAGANPAYDAPADLRFAERMRSVRTTLHLGLHADETAALSRWHLPAAHELESWGDVRAHDGTVTLLQPLIAPLYGGKTALELFALLLGEADPSPRALLRARWVELTEPAWRRAVHDGFIAGSAPAPVQVSLQSDAVSAAPRATPVATGLELVFRPDPSLWDGRYANNAWLQELPKAITRLCWDNAALLSPVTAARLGLETEQVVELSTGGAKIEAPVWILPGQADDTVTIHLGHGRARAGRVGNGIGVDAYPLRRTDARWIARDLSLSATRKRYRLVTPQTTDTMQGRDPVREIRRAELPATKGPPTKGLSLYPERNHLGHAWAMSIDIGACIGCNACVVACQAENNTPIVGKEHVDRGRAMHWLRIDRYFTGDLADPGIVQQPIPCMQCENAPCELVCPVHATTHSPEGLNDMTYNRCVGTRYCGNNCPYKVRRFNFLDFADWETPSLRLQRNPDVSVRSRGVMEKCTYCVQRINEARIAAEREDRPIRDGDIATACEAACPTQAIVFGDKNDPGSRVSKLKRDPRDYALLAELNTRPRTTYLARVTNPNDEIPRGGSR